MASVTFDRQYRVYLDGKLVGQISNKTGKRDWRLRFDGQQRLHRLWHYKTLRAAKASAVAALTQDTPDA